VAGSYERDNKLSGLKFIGPCIVIHFYSKTNQMHNISKFILFWNSTLLASDGLFVHHQESKTVHTASGMSYRHCGCLLASSHRTCMVWCCMYSLSLLMMDGENVRNM